MSASARVCSPASCIGSKRSLPECCEGSSLPVGPRATDEFGVGVNRTTLSLMATKHLIPTLHTLSSRCSTLRTTRGRHNIPGRRKNVRIGCTPIYIGKVRAAGVSSAGLPYQPCADRFGVLEWSARRGKSDLHTFQIYFGELGLTVFKERKQDTSDTKSNDAGNPLNPSGGDRLNGCGLGHVLSYPTWEGRVRA